MEYTPLVWLLVDIGHLTGLYNKKAFEASLGGSIPVNMFSTRAFINWIAKPDQLHGATEFL
jgi:hypothetical protein